jgi:hypothetical protein
VGVVAAERSAGVARDSDGVTLAVAGLLVLAWCVEGFLDLTGLPHRLDVVVDASEVLLCVWLAVRLLRDRAFPRIPILVGLYVVWVLAGFATHAPAGAVITAARNLLLLPALAFLLAASGTTERRARALVVTLVGLSAFELILTVGQAVRFSDADKIVGTFGFAANAATAAALLMTSCVAVAGYLVRAPFGTAALVAGAVFPLFSAWASVKLVPFLLAIAVGAVAIAVLVFRRTTWRRAAAAIATALLASGFVIGYYAAFRPDSYAALFHSDARAKYLKTSSIHGATRNPNGTPRVTGRSTQWRRARHEISGSPTTEVFGKGLGTATVAENLGVYPKDLSRDARLASYSDFGTLLVERGWSGIAIVALLAIALVWTSLRIIAASALGRWTTALTAAVPGVVCVMAAYGPFAEQFRNTAAALTFWVLVAAGLSPREFLGGRPWARAAATDGLRREPIPLPATHSYSVAGRRKTN